jgi:hypothetical protein
VTGLAAPDMRAGTMIVFASDYVHAVGPYRGARPRMTMSWNLTIVPLKGDAGAALDVTHCNADRQSAVHASSALSQVKPRCTAISVKIQS